LEALGNLDTHWGGEPVARQWLNGLINDRTTAAAAEVRGLARTLVQWREPVLAWHTTGHTGGPVKSLNSLIKKVKGSRRGSGPSPTAGCASCSPAAAATGTYSEPRPAETRSARIWAPLILGMNPKLMTGPELAKSVQVTSELR